ncbi:MAG: glycine/sarcosine/betaine reductase complex component C subunit alpha, partial [Synergistaceae bacterium]
MEERNTTKKIIGEVLAEIIQDVKNGCVKKVSIGLMAYGSELGSEELLKGAALAMQNDHSVNVIPIGPKVEGFEQMDWIETPACESDISKAMEDALDRGVISGAVALHYPFPLGVTTIGKVLTPARAKPCFIASSTGTSSSNRVEAMVRNAIYGIAAARADGIASPTVGILNLDGAQTVLRALQKLSEGGYPITFGSSMRKEGGAILRGNDLLAGSVDVCVTDTLTGNVLMKLFAAWNTGGNYEALGWGYGPSAGENWNKVVSIISRASGAPVVAGAITLNARCAKNGLPAAVAEELKLAK